MSLLDIILLLFLGGFVASGFWFGLIHTFGALVGVVVGAAVSSRYFDDAATLIHQYTGGSLNAIRVISFIILFIIIARLLGFIFHIIEKIFEVATVIPFLDSINHVAGAVFGLLEGMLVIGLSLYFAEAYPFSAWLTRMILEQSTFAGYFLITAKILLPLIPEALKEAQKMIP